MNICPNCGYCPYCGRNPYFPLHGPYYPLPGYPRTPFISTTTSTPTVTYSTNVPSRPDRRVGFGGPNGSP